ncbi:MAG: TlpA family protein disulfide reductase [Acidimicrobiia bacterium]
MNRPMMWGSVAVIAVMAMLVVVLAGRFGKDPTAVATPLVGQQVADLRLPYLEAEGEVALAELQGEILVVNFWASWCIPCRAEHPILLGAAGRYADDGVRVVGIVYQDTAKNAVDFLDGFGRGYEIVTDPRGRASIEFGVFGVPETFYIDRKGSIVAVVRGELTSNVMEETVDALIAGRADSGL